MSVHLKGPIHEIMQCPKQPHNNLLFRALILISLLSLPEEEIVPKGHTQEQGIGILEPQSLCS